MAASVVPLSESVRIGGGVSVADSVMFAALVVYVLFLVHDSLRPARRYALVKGWPWAGVIFTTVMVVLTTGVPMAAAPLLGRWSLFRGADLGTWGGLAVGLLATELVGYWVHRVCHRLELLWRWVHQLHHSAERLDSFGAFFFHPAEILLEVGTSLLVSGVILGLTAEATGLVAAAGFAMSSFQHANIRTPSWLGLVVIRPEAHGVHHARGVHNGNFGNLALWDQVFGTFSNPAEAPPLAGFYDGSSRRVKDMLLGKDISVGGLGRAGAAPLRAVRVR
jgi:sterol desaturase/sphingolipid hydroxylase (fatty acid hydroxylase superfamily)